MVAGFQLVSSQKRVKRNKFKNDSAISIWFAEDSKKYIL